MLGTAPSRIAAMAEGLTPVQLRTKPDPENWSAVEVLAHLRCCADVWGDAIRRIRDEDHPTIKAVDPRTWARDTNYTELEFHPSLDAYTSQRANLLTLLEALSPNDLSRAATLRGAGKPIERTLRGFAQRIAIHERPHIKQIDRALKVIREKP